MEALLVVLRAALEHGWRVGVLIACFGAGLLFLAHYQVIASSWKETAALVTLCGLSIIAASIVNGIVGAVLRSHTERNDRRAEQAAIEAEGEDIFWNLQALSHAEADFLVGVLRGPLRRFQVHIASPAYGLIAKRILRAVDPLSNGVICEVHPEILRRKDEFLPALERAIGR